MRLEQQNFISLGKSGILIFFSGQIESLILFLKMNQKTQKEVTRIVKPNKMKQIKTKQII